MVLKLKRNCWQLIHIAGPIHSWTLLLQTATISLDFRLKKQHSSFLLLCSSFRIQVFVQMVRLVLKFMCFLLLKQSRGHSYVLFSASLAFEPHGFDVMFLISCPGIWGRPFFTLLSFKKTVFPILKSFLSF